MSVTVTLPGRPQASIGSPANGAMQVGVPGLQGPPGAPGQSFQLAGAVTDYAALPVLAPEAAGQAWMTNNDGRVYVWSGSAWPAEGTAPVLRGPSGLDGAPGQIRFTGHGAPPPVLVGANPLDVYLDLDTGTTYQLI